MEEQWGPRLEFPHMNLSQETPPANWGQEAGDAFTDEGSTQILCLRRRKTTKPQMKPSWLDATNRPRW